MTQGLILAGGYSSRAKTNKMTLKFQNRELICHTAEAMRPFVDRIVVVTGFYHEDIAKALASDDQVQIVRNPNFEQGMFSSVQFGTHFLNDDFFIIPGDIPLVSTTTYQALLLGSGLLRIPVFHSQKGHPVWIDKSLIPALIAFDKTANLRVFLQQHAPVFIEVDDDKILFDVDTPEDFANIKSSSRKE